MTATALPKDVTNKKVTWKSSAATIVNIDQTRKVTALALGSVIISVTTEDGSKKCYLYNNCNRIKFIWIQKIKLIFLAKRVISLANKKKCWRMNYLFIIEFKI